MEENKGSVSSALLGLGFAIGVDIFRAIVLAFVFNLLLAPAFGLTAISVLTAWTIDMLVTFVMTPAQASMRLHLRDVVYGPMAKPELIQEHLKKSELRKNVEVVIGLFLQALVLAALAYFLA